MMVTARRRVQELGDTAEPGVEETSIAASVQDASVAGAIPMAPSPVHGLQAELEAEFLTHDPGYSRRTVYGAVVIYCFSVWLALYLFASATL